MFNRLRKSFGMSPPSSPAPSTTYDWDAAGTGQTLDGSAQPSDPSDLPPPPTGGFAFRKILTESEKADLLAQSEIERQRREASLAAQVAATQKKLEADAHAKGQFAKKERARYNDRVVDPDTWVPCVIVGVHFDDGPDKVRREEITPR